MSTDPHPDFYAEVAAMVKEKRTEEAIITLARACDGAVALSKAHIWLVRALQKSDRIDDARAILLDAQRLTSEDAALLDALGCFSAECGLHEVARQFFRKAVALEPTNGRFWYNLATSDRNLGDIASARRACALAIAHNPTDYPAYLMRSQLAAKDQSATYVDELQRLLDDPDLPARGRMFLSYALGAALDECGAYDSAFAAFSTGAKLHRARLAYDVRRDVAKMESIQKAYSAELLNRSPQRQNAGENCVFIVGMPRSGTTLVERMLLMARGARSNGETQNLHSALLSQTHANRSLLYTSPGSDHAAIRDEYIRRAKATDADQLVIEKLPMNFLYVGAIHLALPGSRILWLRRHPVDSCFALFRVLFDDAYPFSYDFNDLAAYYSAYDGLFDHWRRTLPKGRLLIVDYDQLVAAPEREARRFVAHCGREWTPSILDYYKHASASTTASAAQVRQPLYATSSGKWRNYERHLGPLIDALRDRGVHVPV